MEEALLELGSVLQDRQTHCLVLHGNVYDRIKFGGGEFEDAVDFLTRFEGLVNIVPVCLTFDLFSGLRVRRGDPKEIAQTMGIKEEKPKGENADLVQALKQAKGKKAGMDGNFPSDPLELFPCLDQLFEKSSKGVLLVIDYAETLFPATLENLNNQKQKVLSVCLTKWSRSQAIRKTSHLIVLVTRRVEELDQTIADRIFETHQIRFGKPTEEERTGFLTGRGVEPTISAKVGKVSAGLACKDLDKILPELTAEKDDAKALDIVFSAKRKILRDEYGDILEVMSPRCGFEGIGGLDYMVDELRSVVAAMREGRTSVVPQGILLCGPPGTGKTIIAEAIAKEAGVNFVKPLDIKSMWVGESEKRMSRFHNALKDLAPVAVFSDEWDQAQSQRGGFDGDSGTSRNLFKKMLEIMSDTSWRGKILWLFATNRPDLIDSAMKRDGRCDMRVPFLPPDEKTYALICKAAFKQYPDMKTEITDWKPFVKDCKGWSGANIVELVRRAHVRAYKTGHAKITATDVEWAKNDYMPRLTNNMEVARMTLLSILECSSRELLPPNWEEIRNECCKVLGIELNDSDNDKAGQSRTVGFAADDLSDAKLKEKKG